MTTLRIESERSSVISYKYPTGRRRVLAVLYTTDIFVAQEGYSHPMFSPCRPDDVDMRAEHVATDSSDCFAEAMWKLGSSGKGLNDHGKGFVTGG